MKTLTSISRIAILLVSIVFTIGIMKAFSQENEGFKTFRGNVVDEITKNPVVFATVSVSGKSTGTVTNNEGEFTIKIKNSSNAASIEISHIGYKTLKCKISDLKSDDNEIKISPSIYTLNEVKVNPYSPYELLQKMIENVNQNYGVKPNMMAGFYREAIKKKSNYIYISEAIIDIYKAPYSNGYDEDAVKVFKGRRSSRARAADTVMIKLKGGPAVAMLLDVIKNPYILFENDNLYNYDLKYEAMKIIDDKPIYVIDFKQRFATYYPLYNGKLYINAETMALTAAEFSLNLTDLEAASRMFIQKKPIGLKFEPLSTNYFVKYKEENGKYYFNYARYEFAFNCDWKKRMFKSKYSVMAELAVTDRYEENAKRFSFKETLDQNDVFADKVFAFTDENFWEDKNYIEPDKSIEEALVKYAKWLKRNPKN